MKDFVLHLPQILDQIVQSIPLFRPEIALIGTFLLSVLATLFTDRVWKYSSYAISLAGLLLSFLFLCEQVNTVGTGFFGMLVIDNLSVYARMLIILSLLVICVFVQQHFKGKPDSKRLGEVYGTLLTAGLGLHLLTLTSNWLMVFIAIETVSISSYILVGYFSENKKQSEASMKYVLFGSTSAAVMLYGLSLVYGFTGNLDFVSPQHIQGLAVAPTVICTIAILFIFTGIGFKLGFVPFHLWTPDVYEGAPTPITAFLSTAPKIGAIIVFSRLTQAWLPTLFYFSEATLFFLVVVAIVTMLVGNLIALRQLNIKRLMAYSSIGHTGFLLMAILALSDNNQEILLFYLAAYTLMTLAAFAFIDSIESATGIVNLNDYTGLGKKFPLLFTCFTFAGISLVGLPPTVGFIGKLLVFTSVFEVYQSDRSVAYLLLLIIGALTSVISLFYYFKIPLFAFLRKGSEALDNKIGFSPILVLGVAMSVLLIILGLFPGLLLGPLK